MAIDYTNDILTLYAQVVSEPEYAAIPANLRDQASEQRILTTIEVLRAHLEILENRTEANLLLEAIARLTARVGSGGFIYDPEIVAVVGNVKSPTIAPGAGCSIDVAGVVTPITTVTGGDLNVVVSELNSALTGAAAEISTFTAQADVAGSLGGKYITMNGPTGAPTDDYYAWFTHPGQAAYEEITMVAANTLALSTTPGGPATEGSYWTFDTVGLDYFVWYNVQAQAEQTTIILKTGTSYTTEVAPGVPPSTPGDYWDLDDLDTPTPGAYRYWYNVEDPLIQDIAMPAAGTTGAPGWVGGGAPANYFKLEVPFGHPAFPGFYVWVDLAYAGGNLDPGVPPSPSAPALAGYTGLRIELTAGPAPTAAALVTEILTNPGNLTTPGTTGIIPDIAAGGEFAGSTTLGGSGVLEVWNTTPGANSLATDGVATGQAFWSGAAPPPILTPGFPPPVGPNVAPASGGRTLVQVATFSQAALSTAIAPLTGTAITTSGADVANTPIGGSINIVQNTAGAVTPIANSGGALFAAPTITVPGIDNNVVPTGGSTVGRTGIQVNVLWSDPAGGVGPNNVASKTGIAINNADAIGAQWMTSTEVRVQHQAVGAVGGASDFNAGVTPLPPLAVGVDPATTDPMPGPNNTVTVTIAVDDSANDVANKTRLAIAAQAAVHFTVGGALAAIQLTNTVGGNAPNATSGDTGWAAPVITDGTAGTPSAIEAYNAGGFLGFRNTTGNPDTAFTLIDGIGGLLGPAGLSAGASEPKKLEVANQGRDRALSVYEGQARDANL